MPNFYMLIGVPAAGKSTWIKQHAKPGTLVASSDDYIEKVADAEGKTYNDVFSDVIKAANNHARQVAKQAYDLKLDLIWDQTNLTRKSRASKLATVPKDYKKIAVFFSTPHPDVHKKRLDSRPGKSIPGHIIHSMISTIEKPSKDEGFDEIITAQNT
jgi:predicted kinase